MKEDSLGLNHLLSFSAMCHTVRPRSSALSSGHLRIAPPKSSSAMPKCFRYHAASAALSPLVLKKTPPIPVTFAILALVLMDRRAYQVGACKSCIRLGELACGSPFARRWPG